MELAIVAGLGLCGAWIVTRLFRAGETAKPRPSGYYVSESYRRRTQRQCRSEYTANIEMRR